MPAPKATHSIALTAAERQSIYRAKKRVEKDKAPAHAAHERTLVLSNAYIDIIQSILRTRITLAANNDGKELFKDVLRSIELQSM